MRKLFLVILSLVIIYFFAMALISNSKTTGFFSTEENGSLKNSVSALVSKVDGEANQIYSKISSELNLSAGGWVAASEKLIRNTASKISDATSKSALKWAESARNQPEPAPVESNITTTPPAPPSNSAGSGASTGYWGQTGIKGLKVYEYGKSLLNAGEQSCYDQIASAVLNVDGSVTIKTGIEPIDIEKVFNYYLSDHPELFYYNSATFSYLSTTGKNGQKNYESYTFSFGYTYSGSTIAAMREKIGETAGTMLAEAAKYSSDYNKEKVLHDALINSCDYDMNAAQKPQAYPQSFTAYGALVNNTAVCEGYAKAMKLLLDSAGLESIYVTGTALNSGGSGSHAWNMVDVSGKWYYLDATFDDPVYVNSFGQYVDVNKISYTYFNFTSMPDHSLGVFNASNPFSDESQNYGVMPKES